MSGFPNEHPQGVRTYGDEADGTWQVMDRGVWIDGYYDSEQTALAAVRHVGSSALADLSQRLCWFYGENRAITQADLDTLAGSGQ